MKAADLTWWLSIPEFLRGRFYLLFSCYTQWPASTKVMEKYLFSAKDSTELNLNFKLYICCAIGGAVLHFKDHTWIQKLIKRNNRYSIKMSYLGEYEGIRTPTSSTHDRVYSLRMACNAVLLIYVHINVLNVTLGKHHDETFRSKNIRNSFLRYMTYTSTKWRKHRSLNIIYFYEQVVYLIVGTRRACP